MPVYVLTDELIFPDPLDAVEHGLLAVGGDLSVERLLLAYSNGIFPWYNEGEPILWWAPDPRFVLFPDQVHVSRTMRKVLRQQRFEITVNEAFGDVIRRCAISPRPGQAGTWITRDMVEAYEVLHQEGHVMSVESWQGGRLAGGLYGVQVGSVFFGESMFSDVTNASKAALLSFIEHLRDIGCPIIDCQVFTPHMKSLGARHIPLAEFIGIVRSATGNPTISSASLRATS